MYQNESFTIEYCKDYFLSQDFLDYSRKFNILATVFIVLFGLTGNILSIIVFIQKKYTLKAPGIFLLFLAISDSLFLITHFFEDTMRTYFDVYFSNDIDEQTFNITQICTIEIQPLDCDNKTYKIFKMINIIDQSDLACKLTSFARYTFRLTSASILTAFTIQRAIVIYFPLINRIIDTTNSSWKTLVGILAFSFITCSFIPFLFKLNTASNGQSYCDTNKNYPTLYFWVTIIYVFLSMIIPIITIFICNTITIIHLLKARNIRYTLTNQLDDHTSRIYCNVIQQMKSQNVTKLLIMISSSYAILNLPYFIIWSIFYLEMANNRNKNAENELFNGVSRKNYLYGFMQLAELLNVLNFGLIIFMYCITGQRFRTHLYNLLACRKYRSNWSNNHQANIHSTVK
jgi:hypothetical protein